MADPYFYCYRCNQHKRIALLSEHTSPSGRSCCVSCTDMIPKGISTGKAAKKLKPSNIDWLANTCR